MFNKFKKNLQENYFFYLLGFLYLVTKLPSINHNLPPYYFACDEGLFSDEVFRMLQLNSPQQEMFKSGPLNVFPIYILYKSFIDIFNISFEYVNLIIFSRYVLTIGLNLLSLLMLKKLLSLFFSKEESKFINLGLLLFVISPYLFAQTRLWYPDSYQLAFSLGLIFYTFKTRKEKLGFRNIIFLSIFSSLIFATKYTGIFITIPAIYVVLEKLFYTFKGYDLSTKILEFLKYFSVSILIFITINLGILLNFEQFLDDFYFNLNNYGGNFNFAWRLIGGTAYYSTFLFIVPFSLFSVFYQITAVIRFLKDKKYFEFFTFFVIPFCFCFYLGGFYLIINRNINFLIPLLIIPICVGIKESLRFQFKIVRILNSFNIICLSIFLIYSFSTTLMDDFEKDSRIEMQNYLLSEPSSLTSLTIGINEGCTGDSPAEGIINTENDRFIENGYDAYLFNSFWNSAIKFQKQNILFVTNHKNTHFDYYLNLDLFNDNFFTQNKILEINQNYKIKKIFGTNGPKMIYLVKK